MKRILFLVCFAYCGTLFEQEKIQPTESFTVNGKVKQSFSFSLKDAASYKQHHIDSLVIYSHNMERRKVLKQVKGVLLKDIIEKAGIEISPPKLMSEFYINCIASDGYLVVFSWNELFNTENGNKVMILTEADGKPASGLEDRIALLSAGDIATGRRYVKGLKEVVIERAQR